MSVCSLEDTHLSQDLLHPSIHSQCAGPIPSQIDTITIEDAEQREELVIFPADQDVEASPKHTTTTTVSPTTVARSNALSCTKTSAVPRSISIIRNRIPTAFPKSIFFRRVVLMAHPFL